MSSSVLNVRMPISEPLAAIALSESGFWMATEPSMKNVAGTRKCWSTASSSAVRSGCGPPSKVRATVAFLSAKVCTGVVRASTTCWPCVTTNGTCCTEGFSAGLLAGRRRRRERCRRPRGSSRRPGRRSLRAPRWGAAGSSWLGTSVLGGLIGGGTSVADEDAASATGGLADDDRGLRLVLLAGLRSRLRAALARLTTLRATLAGGRSWPAGPSGRGSRTRARL